MGPTLRLECFLAIQAALAVLQRGLEALVGLFNSFVMLGGPYHGFSPVKRIWLKAELSFPGLFGGDIYAFRVSPILLSGGLESLHFLAEHPVFELAYVLAGLIPVQHPPVEVPVWSKESFIHFITPSGLIDPTV